MSHEARREIFERGYTAVSLPFDPVHDETVLIERIRTAVYGISEAPRLLEMVVGMIKEGKGAEDVIRHEAIGEAGLIAKRTRPALSLLTGPGGTSKRLPVMVGEVDATATSGVHDLTGENEDIRVHTVSRERVYQRVEEGKIGNAASVIALQRPWLHH